MEDHWRYNIYAREDENSQFEHVGWIDFYKTTPPGCDFCNEAGDAACEECIDNNNILPETNLVEVPVGTDGMDPCADHTLLGGITIIKYNSLINYNFILNACYNTELQRWWFSIEGNALEFKYVLEYCDQNITNKGVTLIDDYENFPQGYGCDLILRDIQAQYIYGNLPPAGGYVLKSMLEAHELKHYLDFAVTLDVDKEELFQNLLEIAPSCEDFNTKEQATTFWIINFSPLLYAYWDQAIAEREKYSKGKGYEEQTHWKSRRNFTQIKINALCFWNCTSLLSPLITCP